MPHVCYGSLMAMWGWLAFSTRWDVSISGVREQSSVLPLQTTAVKMCLQRSPLMLPGMKGEIPGRSQGALCSGDSFIC